MLPSLSGAMASKARSFRVNGKTENERKPLSRGGRSLSTETSRGDEGVGAGRARRQRPIKTSQLSPKRSSRYDVLDNAKERARNLSIIGANSLKSVRDQSLKRIPRSPPRLSRNSSKAKSFSLKGKSDRYSSVFASKSLRCISDGSDSDHEEPESDGPLIVARRRKVRRLMSIEAAHLHSARLLQSLNSKLDKYSFKGNFFTKRSTNIQGSRGEVVGGTEEDVRIEASSGKESIAAGESRRKRQALAALRRYVRGHIAKDYYRRRLAENPHDVRVRDKLGCLLYSLNEMLEALPLLKTVISSSSSSTARTDYCYARAQYHVWVHFDKQCSTLKEIHGAYDRALRHMENLLSPILFLELAHVHSAFGSTDGAITLAQQLLVTFTSQRWRNEVLFFVGCLFFGIDRYDRSLEFLNMLDGAHSPSIRPDVLSLLLARATELCSSTPDLRQPRGPPGNLQTRTQNNCVDERKVEDTKPCRARPNEARLGGMVTQPRPLPAQKGTLIGSPSRTGAVNFAHSQVKEVTRLEQDTRQSERSDSCAILRDQVPKSTCTTEERLQVDGELRAEWVDAADFFLERGEFGVALKFYDAIDLSFTEPRRERNPLFVEMGLNSVRCLLRLGATDEATCRARELVKGVFMEEKTLERLEALLPELYDGLKQNYIKSAILIQSYIRRFLSHRMYKRTNLATKTVHCILKEALCRATESMIMQRSISIRQTTCMDVTTSWASSFWRLFWSVQDIKQKHKILQNELTRTFALWNRAATCIQSFIKSYYTRQRYVHFLKAFVATFMSEKCHRVLQAAQHIHEVAAKDVEEKRVQNERRKNTREKVSASERLNARSFRNSQLPTKDRPKEVLSSLNAAHGKLLALERGMIAIPVGIHDPPKPRKGSPSRRSSPYFTPLKSRKQKYEMEYIWVPADMFGSDSMLEILDSQTDDKMGSRDTSSAEKGWTANFTCEPSELDSNDATKSGTREETQKQGTEGMEVETPELISRQLDQLLQRARLRAKETTSGLMVLPYQLESVLRSSRIVCRSYREAESLIFRFEMRSTATKNTGSLKGQV